MRTSNPYSSLRTMGVESSAAAAPVAAAPAQGDSRTPREPPKGDDEDEAHELVRDFWGFSQKSTTQMIDGLSAMLSAVALVVAFWQLGENGLKAYERPLAAGNTLMAKEGSDFEKIIDKLLAVEFVRNDAKDMRGTCTSVAPVGYVSSFARVMFFGFALPLEPPLPYTLSEARASYEDRLYTGTELSMHAGEFNTMLALVRRRRLLCLRLLLLLFPLLLLPLPLLSLRPLTCPPARRRRSGSSSCRAGSSPRAISSILRAAART